jgi:hypothetical protein
VAARKSVAALNFAIISNPLGIFSQRLTQKMGDKIKKAVQVFQYHSLPLDPPSAYAVFHPVGLSF